MLRLLEQSSTSLNLKSLLVECKNNASNMLTLKNGAKLAGILAASYFGYFTMKICWLKRRYAHIPGPESHGLSGFFLGNLSNLEEMTNGGKVLSDFLYEWHMKYGPTIKFRMLDLVLVSTTDPNALKEIFLVKKFSKKTDFNNFGKYLFFQRYIGNGLVSELDDEVWKKQRAIFNPGFSRNILNNYILQFNEKSNILMEKLRLRADGKTVVTLLPEFNYASLDIISLVAFGMTTDAINGNDLMLNDYLSKSLWIAGDVYKNPFYLLNPFNWKSVYEFIKMVRYLRQVGKERIAERLNNIDSVDEQKDILSSIIKMAREQRVDIETMVDNFVTFFIAGQESTAIAIALFILELGRNGECLEKCRAEIDDVLGSRTELTHEDLAKLKYTTAAFKESMRLYPSAPEVSRRADEAMDIQGVRVPKHSQLLLSTYACGRLESNFEDPFAFKPERFLNANVPIHAYFPFSIGQHSCIGQNFAIVESIVVITKFLQSFDFNLDPTQSFKLIQEISLKPQDGTRVILKLRK